MYGDRNNNSFHSRSDKKNQESSLNESFDWKLQDISDSMKMFVQPSVEFSTDYGSTISPKYFNGDSDNDTEKKKQKIVKLLENTLEEESNDFSPSNQVTLDFEKEKDISSNIAFNVDESIRFSKIFGNKKEEKFQLEGNDKDLNTREIYESYEDEENVTDSSYDEGSGYGREKLDNEKEVSKTFEEEEEDMRNFINEEKNKIKLLDAVRIPPPRNSESFFRKSVQPVDNISGEIDVGDTSYEFILPLSQLRSRSRTGETLSSFLKEQPTEVREKSEDIPKNVKENQLPVDFADVEQSEIFLKTSQLATSEMIRKSLEMYKEDSSNVTPTDNLEDDFNVISMNVTPQSHKSREIPINRYDSSFFQEPKISSFDPRKSLKKKKLEEEEVEISPILEKNKNRLQRVMEESRKSKVRMEEMMYKPHRKKSKNKITLSPSPSSSPRENSVLEESRKKNTPRESVDEGKTTSSVIQNLSHTLRNSTEKKIQYHKMREVGRQKKPKNKPDSPRKSKKQGKKVTRTRKIDRSLLKSMNSVPSKKKVKNSEDPFLKKIRKFNKKNMKIMDKKIEDISDKEEKLDLIKKENEYLRIMLMKQHDEMSSARNKYFEDLELERRKNEIMQYHHLHHIRKTKKKKGKKKNTGSKKRMEVSDVQNSPDVEVQKIDDKDEKNMVVELKEEEDMKTNKQDEKIDEEEDLGKKERVLEEEEMMMTIPNPVPCDGTGSKNKKDEKKSGKKKVKVKKNKGGMMLDFEQTMSEDEKMKRLVRLESLRNRKKMQEKKRRNRVKRKRKKQKNRRDISSTAPFDQRKNKYAEENEEDDNVSEISNVSKLSKNSRVSRTSRISKVSNASTISSFRKVKMSRRSNKQLIKLAISHVCLAGVVNEKDKKEVLRELETCARIYQRRNDTRRRRGGNENAEDEEKFNFDYHNHFLILIRKENLPLFKGLYVALSQDLGKFVKICGKGPSHLETQDVEFFFRFDSGTKKFIKLHSKGFGVTVDGIVLPPKFRKKRKKKRKKVNNFVKV